jgi:3-oxoacyl-[acyl-carrier-protein] synthase-3
MAHVVQRHFGLRGARAIYLSTACSSFINALELVAAYVETKRARQALIVASEHNSLYSNDENEQSGHLWGDAAAALLVTAEPMGSSDGLTVVDVSTVGLADVGAGPTAVYLTVRDEGLVMPNGKDVFNNACREMENAATAMLARHGLAIERMRLVVPHQANQRIIDQVSRRMGVQSHQLACTIRELGNTGSTSIPIALLRSVNRLQAGDFSLLVTFGGGYSAGCALLQRR